jgi:hypothetical protein
MDQQEHHNKITALKSWSSPPVPPPEPSFDALLGKAPEEAALYKRNLREYQRRKAWYNSLH